MSRGLCCLVALVLSVAPAVARGDGPGGGEHVVRLAATLTGAGETMALIAAGERQAWLRPGDLLGACALQRVEATGAELDCSDGRLRLPLEGSASAGRGDVLPKRHVVLPPGWIESLAARPQALALGLDIVPEADVAGLRGWRITRLDPASPLSPLGLREEDLLLAVAGFPAAEPGSLVAGLSSLPKLGSFSVTLQRDGRVIDLAIVAPRSDTPH